MGLLDNIFGKSENDQKLNEIWTEITSISDLDVILEESTFKTVGIFKHSTRCSISRMVLEQFERKNSSLKNIKFYYLDLLNYRSISSEIADRFGVVHQSPQLILIKDKKAILDASHNRILSVDFDDNKV